MTNKLHTEIINTLKENQHVLDCGCGNGDLLKQLKSEKNITGYGIDNNSTHVMNCINKGLSVYHGDILEGLTHLPDKSYDAVILSQTLQQIQYPIETIRQMCRIGHIVIVSFPNFAYWRCRLSLLNGYIPKTKMLPFDWYDTPNIRVISIKSFKRVCKQENITIMNQINLINNKLLNLNYFSNSQAEEVLFILKKI